MILLFLTSLKLNDFLEKKQFSSVLSIIEAPHRAKRKEEKNVQVNFYLNDFKLIKV